MAWVNIALGIQAAVITFLLLLTVFAWLMKLWLSKQYVELQSLPILVAQYVSEMKKRGQI